MAELTTVVPTRDRLRLLTGTLGAILAQRDVDVRVVVVDEGSSDGTAEWLAQLDEPRVTVVRHDDPVGLPAARNRGLARATTPYVAFCDDDDVWSPTKARAQLDAIVASPGARWATCGAMLVDPELRPLGHLAPGAPGRLIPELLVGNVVPASGSGILAETSLVRSLGGYDEAMRASEDWDMCVRLALEAPAAAANGPHVAYRLYPGSMSTGVERMRASFQVMAERYGSLARQHGVELDEHGYERFLARQQISGGARTGAARIYLDLAVKGHRPAYLGRAVLALVAPSTLDRVGARRALERIPPDWLATYEGWVGRLRDLDDAPTRPATRT